ncbi:MAG TPA: glycosyltransferase [Chitinophagaceae bacterium]
MRFLLIHPPPGDRKGQRLAALLEQLVAEICTMYPGYDCRVQAGQELPGPLSLIGNFKREKAIREAQADLVIYSSFSNVLIPSKVKAVVITADPLDGAPGPKRIKKRIKGKLAGVITDTNALKATISGLFPNRENNIYLLKLMEPELIEPFAEGEEARSLHASGKEYFFYGGDISRNNEWEKILQAFSIFKKWQRSSLGLVLGGQIETGYEKLFGEKLNAYKYHTDIICLNTLSSTERKEVISGAFALLSGGLYFGEKMDIAQAYRSGIPVITDQNSIAAEFCGEAALYADFKDHDSISRQMISMYKNEDEFIRLVEKGKAVMTRFNQHELLHDLNTCLLHLAER